MAPRLAICLLMLLVACVAAGGSARALPAHACTGVDEPQTLTSPDSGQTGYRHDADGNETVQADARNRRALRTCDAANRLTQIEPRPRRTRPQAPATA